MAQFGDDHDHPAMPGGNDVTRDDRLDLQESLADLAGLVTGSLGLQELLGQVATFAAHAIPGADGAGVTLLRMDEANPRVEALAASADFVSEIDELQYRVLGEGPCITAALQRRSVRSGSLGGDKLWPRFGPRVGRMGVHSALSLPLLLPGQLVGALNTYAHVKHAFDERAAHIGELFCAPAAVAVHNAHVLAQAQTLTHQLHDALSRRPTIDQAIGILRARSGSTAEEAFERLRVISQAEHVKLAVVAQQIVDRAVRRARARGRLEAN